MFQPHSSRNRFLGENACLCPFGHVWFCRIRRRVQIAKGQFGGTFGRMWITICYIIYFRKSFYFKVFDVACEALKSGFILWVVVVVVAESSERCGLGERRVSFIFGAS